MSARRSHSIEWLKFMEVFLGLGILPTAFFYSIACIYPGSLRFCYYFFVSLFVFQSALSYIYTTVAFARKKFSALPGAKHQPPPKTTFLISAYLPNEVEVIEETLTNILERVKRPDAGIEVILAYNTPHMEGIEPRLREMACRWPELILANAYGSRSKSKNLNYALDLATGEMTVLLDADHLIAPECIAKAWRWLDEGYSVVQGRCKIRNGDETLITSLVDIEFVTIYGISHHAKSKLFDSALFGGTNGFWKTAVLKTIRFNESRLTEDIDATLRAILNGYRIVHDRSIISSELAPRTLPSLWYQRKRWAQGWFQCSVRYQFDIFVTPHLNFFQKFMWTTLLLWRVIFDILGHFLFPVVFAFWLQKGAIEFPMNTFVWFSLLFTLFSGPYETIGAYMNATHPRPSVFKFILYAFMTFPYTLFKNSIQVVAIRDELLGDHEWRVTKRTAQ